MSPSIPMSARFPSPVRAVVRSLTLAAALTVSVAQANTVLLSDQFADGSRTNESLPASARWTYNGDSLTARSVSLIRYSSGDELLLTRGSPAQTSVTAGYFTEANAPQVLADGDAIFMSFTLRTGVAVNAANLFRFGLFNSMGERPTADMTLSQTNISDSRLRPAQGYSVWINPGATAPASFSVYRRTPVSAAHPLLLTAGTPAVAINERLGADNLDTLALPLNQKVAYTLSVKRTGSALTIDATVNGHTVSRTDAAPANNFAFDMIAFYAEAGLLSSSQPNALFDDFVVEYRPLGGGDGGRVTLLNERFDDGERNTQALPGSAQWFYKGSNTAPQTSATQLRIPVPGFTTPNDNLDLIVTYAAGGGTLTAPFTTVNNPRTLAIGDSLTARYSVQFGALRPLNNAVRVGLFDSQGVRPAADFTAVSSPANVYAGYRGFSAWFNPAPAAPAPFGFYERTGAGPALFAASEQTALGAAPLTSTGLSVSQFTRGSLKLTRLDAGTLRIESAFNGVTRSADVAASQFAFDTFGLHLADGAILEGETLRLDDVAILYTAAAPTKVASASTILSEDFTGAGWPAASFQGANATGAVTSAEVGTIDAVMGVTGSRAVALSVDSSGATGPWTATLRSGILAVANTLADPAFLTLAFDLNASSARPVIVSLESYDAANVKTGRLERTVYPAAPNAWQRFAFELDAMTVVEPGFDATAPGLRLSFAVAGGNGAFSDWAPGSHTLRLDNVHYARPAYFVKPSGNNALDGRSVATAFATPAKAVQVAQAGDIVLFMSDPALPERDYLIADETQINTQGIFIANAGRPAGWVTFKNYPGQMPRLQTFAWRIFGVGGNGSLYSAPIAYVEFRGLSLRGAAATALAESQKGLVVGVSNNIGIDVNGRPSVNTPHHVRIADCLAFELSQVGFSAIESDYVRIENNVVYGNCLWTRYGSSGISLLNASVFDPIINDYRFLILGNRVFSNECRVPAASLGVLTDGNGIIVDTLNNGSQPTRGAFKGRTLIQNNLAYDNGGGGIHVFNSNRVDIVNNTAYGNNQIVNYGQITQHDSNDGFAINNILVATDGKNTTFRRNGTLPGTSPSVFINNLYVRSPGGPAPGGLPGDIGNATVADVLFVNAAGGDFRLRAGSPAFGFGATSPLVPVLDHDALPRPAGPIDVGAHIRQPLILDQPAAFTAAVAGAPVTLSVGAVSGVPAELTYQWRLNGADVPGATGATLAFPAITPAQAGTYRVVVSSGFDTATSAEATVTVLSAQDGDGDGLADPLEFALGSLANSPASAAAPTLGVNAGQLTLTFARARAEVTYLVQASDNLLTWTDLATNPGAVGADVTVTDVGSASPTRFLRLQVKLGTTTLNTVPVGRQKIALAAGATTAFGVALDDTTPPPAGIRAGKLEAFTATTVTNALGGWTAPLGTVAAPWALRLTSGPAAGKILDVTANTATSLTVSGADLTTLGLTAGVDTFELIPLDTLGSLFGAATLQGGSTAATADQVQVRSGSTWLVYYYDTALGFWRRTIGPATNSDNVRIRPETGVQVLRRGAALPLSFTGRVLATAFRPAVTNASTTVLHAGFPQDTTLGALAVQTLLPGWRNGTTSAADQVFLYNGAAWVGYVYNGTNWQPLVGPATNSDALALPSSALITIQRPGATAGTTDLVRALPYSP